MVVAVIGVEIVISMQSSNSADVAVFTFVKYPLGMYEYISSSIVLNSGKN